MYKIINENQVHVRYLQLDDKKPSYVTQQQTTLCSLMCGYLETRN